MDLYAGAVHKTAYRGKDRTIFFGPECQKILTPLLLRAGGGPLFSPARSQEDRIAERSAERKTPRWPSHMKRNERKRKRSPKWKPGQCYRQGSLCRALARASETAGLAEPIRPHQLRHLAGTTIRGKLGLEAARATLGHSAAAMTEVYSNTIDAKLARDAAAAVG